MDVGGARWMWEGRGGCRRGEVDVVGGGWMWERQGGCGRGEVDVRFTCY